MLMLLVALILAVGPSLPVPSIPTAVGTVWRYRAKVEWTLAGTRKVQSADIPWNMTVVAVTKDRGGIAVVVRGFPTDLAWYEPGITPRLSVLVMRPDGLYLHEPEEQGPATDMAHAALSGKIEGDQLLRARPSVGDCLGQSPARADGLYCWRVERELKVDGRSGWAVAYRTNPDHEIIEFVPGIGVTGFEYGHHGTRASARLRLESLEKPR